MLLAQNVHTTLIMFMNWWFVYIHLLTKNKSGHAETHQCGL